MVEPRVVYRIREKDIVSEEVDGEVIAIDLATGNYYSLTGAASDVWGLLAAGVDAERAAAVLGQRYEAMPGELGENVTRLFAELEAEALVVRDSNAESPVGADRSSDRGARRPFVPPRLERFSDLQGFLLVDPIHEVGESGWPHRA